MVIHAIVDYTYLYYKYKFKLESGKVKRLTIPYDDGSVTIEKDISIIYYSIKEIEGFRKELEGYGHQVITSVCFDMPSMRTVAQQGATASEAEVASKYKSKRVKRLSESDFLDIQLVEKLLSEAGHNTYRILGYEADDIVAHLVDNYQAHFDYTIIYTADKDLLVNINNKVGAKRYKSTKGYAMVDMNNFEDYVSNEFECGVPYNALMLLLSTVGDNSDTIPGIKKFGPKAFDKLVAHLNNKGVDWTQCGNYATTAHLIQMCKGYLKDEQINQALDSLSVVRPMIVEPGTIEDPSKMSTRELREKSYMKLKMQSLIV